VGSPQISSTNRKFANLRTYIFNIAFCCLKYTKSIRGKPMRIWIRNTAFFLANLQICDLRTGTPRKFADLRFDEYPSKFSDLRTGTPQQLADFRLRNEPKNLRICDLRAIKKISMPTFDKNPLNLCLIKWIPLPGRESPVSSLLGLDWEDPEDIRVKMRNLEQVRR
jgi:hypothetical protein